MGRDWQQSRSRSAKRREERNSIGCMRSVLQLFDFHQFQCFSQQRQEPHQNLLLLDPIFIKGVEAARNLELDERPTIAGTSSSSSFSGFKGHEEDDVSFRIQLRPVKPSSLPEQRATESSGPPTNENTTSQGSKTPNLVARLMGLDLLPDDISSTTSSPICRRLSPKYRHDQFIHHHLKDKRNIKAVLYESGTRSLPDTPRISLARRSDVDARHSLQLNKENINTSEFSTAVLSKLASSSSPLSSKKARSSNLKPCQSHEENNRSSSPSRNATKRMKANFSRKFGVDLTNIKIHDSGETRGRNISKPVEAEDHRPRSIKPPSSPPPLKPTRDLHKWPLPKLSEAKCKKASCERFSTRKPKRSPPPLATIQSLQEEIFARPTMITTKKMYEAHGRHATCMGWDSPQLSRSSGSAGLDGKYGRARVVGVRDDRTVSPEFRYIRGILERTGIDTRLPVPVSLSVWHSPSHPLDPSLFLALESSASCYYYSGPLRTLAGRRLLFDLVDEHMVRLLLPRPSSGRAVTAAASNLSGARLLDIIWTHVRSISSADYRAHSDRDAQVGSELGETAPDGLEEQWELMAAEIEREVVDSLVGEAVLCLNGLETGLARFEIRTRSR